MTSHILVIWILLSSFYSASAWLTLQSDVLARAMMSVRHTPVSCPDEWRYDGAVFSIW